MRSEIERISLNNERLESKVERFTTCPICDEEVILFHTGSVTTVAVVVSRTRAYLCTLLKKSESPYYTRDERDPRCDLTGTCTFKFGTIVF